MQSQQVSILILGAGWTFTFLKPMLEDANITYAATTTTGRDDTLKFRFDGDSEDSEPYRILPSAQTILITFPLKGPGQSKHLLELYASTHPGSTPRYIQLGSTGIWQIPGQPLWMTRHSTYDKENARAVAEDELRALRGCVLNLAGLWGGSRQPRDWVERVAPTKEQLAAKTSLHMVHGQDVARAIVALHDNFTPGERWMLTDMFVYDWWALALAWGGRSGGGENEGAQGPHPDWVRELMIEHEVKALPRSMESLGRCYDSREFWEKMHIAPIRARI